MTPLHVEQGFGLGEAAHGALAQTCAELTESLLVCVML